MRIGTNFVRSPQRAARQLSAGLLLLCVGLLAAIAWLLHDGSRLREQQAVLNQQAARLRTEAAEPPPQGPPASALTQTRNRVAAVNAVVRTRGLPTLSLLAELEALLPARVWLASLHHRASDGEVQLVVLAAQPELLYGLLQKLERSPHVEQATLVRAVQPAQGQRDGLAQFEIRLKVRS